MCDLLFTQRCVSQRGTHVFSCLVVVSGRTLGCTPLPQPPNQAASMLAGNTVHH
jgi:hypothetical protein